jgi:hypothetical protein
MRSPAPDWASWLPKTLQHALGSANQVLCSCFVVKEVYVKKSFFAAFVLGHFPF